MEKPAKSLKLLTVPIVWLVLWGGIVQSLALTIPANKTVLIVMRPTAANLLNLNQLCQYSIIPEDEFYFIGVYQKQENYQYEESEKYIRQNMPGRAELFPVESSVPDDSLFQTNRWSDDFKLLFESSQGIIFNGGPDIPSFLFNEKTSLLSNITDPWRHYFELSFLFHLLGGRQNDKYKPLLEENPRYLVMGFCLGMQSINVATGGTLYQDIPSEIYHANYLEDILEMARNKQHKNYWIDLTNRSDLLYGAFHPIIFTENKWAFELGTDPKSQPIVFSAHHQAVKKLGKHLRISATSSDGKIVEAIVHEKYPYVIGVQFHPEASILYDSLFIIKITPTDHVGYNPQTLLKDSQSLNFHKNFWRYYLSAIKKK